MRIISSFARWTAGIFFFMLGFCILAFSLTFLPRERTFASARLLFSGLIKLMGIQLIVEGKSHITAGQTYLIMGNHQSLFDLFVIPSAIPLVFTGVEAAYHFSIPIWGYLIRRWGCIPIQRRNIQEAKKSLDIARHTLQGGLSIAILPEGHRTRTGKMAKFKKGPFHLAHATGATILPFGIQGLYEFQQRGGFLIRPGKVWVRIGEPMSYGAYKDLSVEALRDKLYSKIQTLSGETLS